LTARVRHVVVAIVVIAAALGAVLGRRAARKSSEPASNSVARSGQSSQVTPGGSLVGSVRAEPRSFNSYIINGQTEETVTFLTQAKLVRVNRITEEVEPWLAESWTEVSGQATLNNRQSAVDSPHSPIPKPKVPTRDPGPVYRVKLREGVTFSDGAPFTSADVLFAFEAIYDPRVMSPLADSLRVGGQPLEVRPLGDHEVEVAFPSPYGPGLRLLDTLWVLPKHKLEQPLRAGSLAQAWSPTTAVSEMAGLGPFVLRQYRPGERMVFERNPHYWRRDEQGRQLPYLDRITLEILPDQTAELLRLQSGQLDLTHGAVRSEDYLSLKRAQDEGRVRLLDLGVGLDADPFWFNLSHQPVTVGAQPDAKPWLRTLEFRKAVSLAINRRAYSDTVFLGAAVPLHGPVTPGNAFWYWSDLAGGEYDPMRATALLAGLGLTDRNGDGVLEDARARPVRFTVLLQRGIAAVERGAVFIRDELARVGVGLDIVGLDAGAVFARWGKGDYEAIFHRLLLTNTDPAASLDFWLSSGGSHVWNPSQKTPATEWEKQIDDVMRRQVASSDRDERLRLFREVQRIFSDQMPILYFAAQRQFLATSTRVTNAKPSRLIPLLLWSADTLAVASQR
jgi:peptide/nickel transport system substrate-binding protein